MIADILEIYVRKEQNDTMISSFWSALLSGPIKLETSVKDNFLWSNEPYRIFFNKYPSGVCNFEALRSGA